MGIIRDRLDYLALYGQSKFLALAVKHLERSEIGECAKSIACQLRMIKHIIWVAFNIDEKEITLQEIDALLVKIKETECYVPSKLPFPFLVKPNLDPDDEVITVVDIHNLLKGIQGGKPGEYYHLTACAASKAEALCDPYTPIKVGLTIANNNIKEKGTTFIPALTGTIDTRVVEGHSDIVTGWRLKRSNNPGVVLLSATGLNSTDELITVTHSDTNPRTFGGNPVANGIFDTTTYYLEVDRLDNSMVIVNVPVVFEYPIYFGMVDDAFIAANNATKQAAIKNMLTMNGQPTKFVQGKTNRYDVQFVGDAKYPLIAYRKDYGVMFKVETPSLIDSKPAFTVSPSPYTVPMNFTGATVTLADIDYYVFVHKYKNTFLAGDNFSYDLRFS